MHTFPSALYWNTIHTWLIREVLQAWISVAFTVIWSAMGKPCPLQVLRRDQTWHVLALSHTQSTTRPRCKNSKLLLLYEAGAKLSLIAPGRNFSIKGGPVTPCLHHPVVRRKCFVQALWKLVWLCEGLCHHVMLSVSMWRCVCRFVYALEHLYVHMECLLAVIESGGMCEGVYNTMSLLHKCKHCDILYCMYSMYD